MTFGWLGLQKVDNEWQWQGGPVTIKVDENTPWFPGNPSYEGNCADFLIQADKHGVNDVSCDVASAFGGLKIPAVCQIGGTCKSDDVRSTHTML